MTHPATFGELLEQHEREIFAYALRLVGDRDDADDVYQDTFLAAFRAWPPPRRGHERAWLYKIATNKAIARGRRAKRFVRLGDLPLAAPERDGVSLADLATAVKALPTGQRAAFVLRKVQALSCVDEVARELDQDWSRKRRDFDSTVDLSPLTPFQQKVLAVTARVHYGQLITYAKVAHNVGNDRAYRAAAGAIGDNPIPIVVPCHRVVASDGTLGGYAGGLDAKRRLLQLERGAVPPGGWPPAHMSRT